MVAVGRVGNPSRRPATGQPPAPLPLRLVAEVADGRVDCLTFQVSFWEWRWSRAGRSAWFGFPVLELIFPFLAAL